MSIGRNWRYVTLIAAIVAAMVYAVAFNNSNKQAVTLIGSSAAEYEGSDLGGEPAPTFTLTSQTGAPVSLSDYRGRAVVLSFLDGHCDDICPYMLEIMAETEDALI